MKPANLDLEIFQGATFKKQFQYKTGSTPSTVVVDLTGCKIRMHIREKLSSVEPFVELTTDNGKINIIDPEEGIFLITLSASDTANINESRGVYDLEIEFTNGEVFRILYGEVSINKEITR